jgi:hypothetical protein
MLIKGLSWIGVWKRYFSILKEQACPMEKERIFGLFVHR